MQKVFDKIWIADCLYHQEALGAVRAEREGDGSAVSICQADEWRSRLCHVCQAAEPTVLHAAACQRGTAGKVNTNFFFLNLWSSYILKVEREVPTLGSLRSLEKKERDYYEPEWLRIYTDNIRKCCHSFKDFKADWILIFTLFLYLSPQVYPGQPASGSYAMSSAGVQGYTVPMEQLPPGTPIPGQPAPRWVWGYPRSWCSTLYKY